MKLVLVKITLETDPAAPGLRMYRYPASYDANEVELAKRGPHVYEGTMTVLRLAESEELLLCLADEVADKLTGDGSGLSREVTQAEADAWLEVVLASAPDEMVTNPTRLSIINAKVAAGVALTQDDADVLDLDNPKAIVARVPKTADGIFKLSAIPADLKPPTGAEIPAPKV